ncbi:MAG: hypothetical protein LBP59_10255 [Planctomycetaceae bacterium]|nr:hypothetical protein [Planctomycetaceae bacterium]
MIEFFISTALSVALRRLAAETAAFLLYFLLQKKLSLLSHLSFKNRRYVIVKKIP